jgi:LAO/AO transport system kinase
VNQQLASLLERFDRRDRRALARVLSILENQPEIGQDIVSKVYRDTGRATIVGITGPPGAGKSTLVNALILNLRARGRTVGVLAVDPSSPVSGGATLGDRIRMLESWRDDGVYIRSMATRGQLGGLALAVSGATHLLDAFGFDTVLIETVGVGQAEIDIAAVAETTVLVQVPGLGDGVQVIKAGVLEIADILAVNKADLPGTIELVNELQAMLRTGPRTTWTPPIVQTTATSGAGLEDLVVQIDKHRDFLSASEEGRQRRLRRTETEVLQVARWQLEAALRDQLILSESQSLVGAVAARELSPLQAARRLVHDLAPTQHQSVPAVRT